MDSCRKYLTNILKETGNDMRKNWVVHVQQNASVIEGGFQDNRTSFPVENVKNSTSKISSIEENRYFLTISNIRFLHLRFAPKRFNNWSRYDNVVLDIFQHQATF